jgi:hypothetical protein
MMHTFDPARVEALERLLARPDPADLPRRAHVYRCMGDPDRRETRLPGIVTGWLQRRHLNADPYEPVAAATRSVKRPGRLSTPRLRVLRPTGTG